jgi:oligopeptide/dipeptide ABC transporter ATP-binding protein
MSPLLEVRGLRKDYRRGGAVLHAVDGVDIMLAPGEAVGVIGESGSGKSTLARCITRLERPTDGRIVFQDREITALPDRALRWFRRQVQPVFQDPLTSLNPRWNVRQLISEPLKVHGEDDVERRVAEVLHDVGLAQDLLPRRPGNLSGGERQRVAIARAIVIRPAVLVLDEPTASVDMSMRRSLLALLQRLQSEHGLTCLYISHDIRTIEQTCSRTVVMYRGRIAEEGPTADVLGSPQHVYTQVLVSAIPRAGAAEARHARLKARSEPGGGASSPGCMFADRCPRALPECSEPPPAIEVRPGHFASCVLASDGG